MAVLLVDLRAMAWLVVAMVVAQIVQSLMYAPLGALYSEMFDTTVRYTGASMGYQLAALLGAGFTPMIASSLLVGEVTSVPLVALAMGCGAVTVLAVWRVRETRGVDLARVDPAGVAVRAT